MNLRTCELANLRNQQLLNVKTMLHNPCYLLLARFLQHKIGIEALALPTYQLFFTKLGDISFSSSGGYPQVFGKFDKFRVSKLPGQLIQKLFLFVSEFCGLINCRQLGEYMARMPDHYPDH